jgi:hypothetical protein
MPRDAPVDQIYEKEESVQCVDFPINKHTRIDFLQKNINKIKHTQRERER